MLDPSVTQTCTPYKGFTQARGGAPNFVLENRPEQPSGSDYDSRHVFYTEPISDLTENTFFSISCFLHLNECETC